jgi:hypothetical protein
LESALLLLLVQADKKSNALAASATAKRSRGLSRPGIAREQLEVVIFTVFVGCDISPDPAMKLPLIRRIHFRLVCGTSASEQGGLFLPPNSACRRDLR